MVETRKLISDIRLVATADRSQQPNHQSEANQNQWKRERRVFNERAVRRRAVVRDGPHLPRRGIRRSWCAACDEEHVAQPARGQRSAAERLNNAGNALLRHCGFILSGNSDVC